MKRIDLSDTLLDIIKASCVALILFIVFRSIYYSEIILNDCYINLISLFGGLILGILYLVIKYSQTSGKVKP